MSVLCGYLKDRFNQLQKAVAFDKIPVMTEEGTKPQDSSSDEEFIMPSTGKDKKRMKKKKNLSAKDKHNKIIDSLLTTFENRILNLTESKLCQYVFFYLCSIDKTFRQKLLTLLIIKSYSKKIHVSLRMHYVNFFCSFLARQDGWVATDTVLKSLVIFQSFTKR